ncbi:PAS domain S-box protein [Caulobacter sp. KR2-114]|uniref:PAS domain S-box protein n=1 Tax=Caulobacter sp. KR2-114 TaxID=3400912 RepID=UPI003C0019A6
MFRDGSTPAAEVAQFICDHTADVIVQVNIDGVVTYVSPSIRNYGYAPEDLLGTDGAQFAHPDDRAHLLANNAALLRGEEDPAASRVHRMLRASGEVVWMEGNPRIIRDGDGRACAFVNIFRDITARRAVEAQASEQLAQFEAAFKYAAVGKALVSLDGRFLRVNDAFCRMTGYAEAEMLALDFQAITHPDDLDLDLGNVDRLTRGAIDSYHMDKRYLRKNGSAVWVQLTVSMVRNADGSPKGFVAQVQDLTERRAAEEALRDSEARYRLIADNTSDMIVVTDLTGEVRYVSPSVRHTGWTREALVGASFARQMHPEDARAVGKAFAGLLKGVDPGSVRWRGRHGVTGEWMWMESRPVLLPDPQTGRASGFIDVVRDITGQVEQEEALAAARAQAEVAAAAKAQFLANMSHEIRTPLTAVLGFTGLLRDHPSLDTVAAGYVSRIATAGSGLLALVNDILDFSKLEAGEIRLEHRPLAVREVVESVTQIFEAQAAARGLTLTAAVAADMPASVRGDAQRLRQILLNLVGNAVKFTASGSIQIAATWDAGRNTAIFSVRDTGPGISAEGQACLFQRFSQVDGGASRAQGGTGLGLAICRGLVEAMGGEIGVTSTEGSGSDFHFEFPAPPMAAPSIQPAAAHGPLPCPGSRVLVVDDNAVNRELVTALLGAFDLELTTADSGEAALSLCATDVFDLVLMDIRMPGMGGREALQRLRAAPGPNAGAPVIAFTADADKASVEGLLADGFDGHLGKPIDPDTLLSEVARWTSPNPWEMALERRHG